MTDSLTPLQQLIDDPDFSGIFIKREDLSETGSHKFRYLQEKMKLLKQEGIHKVVLSTTGNAGITASYYGSQLGIEVFCLMSELADKHKAAQIQQFGGKVIMSNRPIRMSKYLAKKLQAYYLRTSSDDFALECYHSLGEEILEQLPEVDAVINFSSSGSSTVGMMQAFESSGAPLPALHVVQSGFPHSVAEALHPEKIDRDDLQGKAGLDTTPLQDQLLWWIEESDGDAWYVSAQQRQEVLPVLTQHGLDTSFEGVSCFWVARELRNRYDHIAVIFSGRNWQTEILTTFRHANDFNAVDFIVREFESESL